MVLTWLLSKTISFNISTIRYKKHALKAYVADDIRKRMVGLMYRDGIKDDQAMLLVSPHEDRLGIWMQNMRFPIDIIWIDSKKRIVDIVRNAPPAKSGFDWTTYSPRRPARYVLEVNSGVAAKLGMRPRDKVSFTL